MEDTRKALIEAQPQGILSFCITIEKEAASYLKRMQGEVTCILIDGAKRRPRKITKMYRRLTTRKNQPCGVVAGYPYLPDIFNPAVKSEIFPYARLVTGSCSAIIA